MTYLKSIFDIFYQEQDDFVECMDANGFAPRIFSETFQRCQIGKMTRTCLHKVSISHFLQRQFKKAKQQLL